MKGLEAVIDRMMKEEVVSKKTSYEVWESGGGCQALRRDLPSGKMFLITTEEGCELPVEGERASIGFYSADDELIAMKTIKWNRPAPGYEGGGVS